MYERFGWKWNRSFCPWHKWFRSACFVCIWILVTIDMMPRERERERTTTARDVSCEQCSCAHFTSQLFVLSFWQHFISISLYNFNVFDYFHKKKINEFLFVVTYIAHNGVRRATGMEKFIIWVLKLCQTLLDIFDTFMSCHCTKLPPMSNLFHKNFNHIIRHGVAKAHTRARKAEGKEEEGRHEISKNRPSSIWTIIQRTNEK